MPSHLLNVLQKTTVSYTSDLLGGRKVPLMEATNMNLVRLTLPEQASTFIADAERAFNTRDVEASCAAYASNAVVELWTDGLHDRLSGIDEIRQGWSAIFAATPRFWLTKRIILASSLVIVNEWFGSLDRSDQPTARGIEVWRFNEAGLVIDHHLYSFLRTYEVDAWLGKAIFGFAHPIVGVRLERKRRRLRRSRPPKWSA